MLAKEEQRIIKVITLTKSDGMYVKPLDRFVNLSKTVEIIKKIKQK